MLLLLSTLLNLMHKVKLYYEIIKSEDDNSVRAVLHSSPTNYIKNKANLTFLIYLHYHEPVLFLKEKHMSLLIKYIFILYIPGMKNKNSMYPYLLLLSSYQ